MDQETISLIMKSLNELSSEETSFVITNQQKVIYYQPSKKVNLRIQVGDNINKDSLSFKAMQNRERVAEEKDCLIFGVQYYGISIPIIKDGILKGSITSVYSQKPQLITSSFLTVKSADRWLPIHFKNIIYMEAQNRKTNVQTTLGDSTHRYNLSELEASLPRNVFIRCHRSFIININHVEEILPDSHSTFLLVMTGNVKIPVSQSYASYFRKLLNF